MTSDKQPATSIKFLFWLYTAFVIYSVTLPLHPDLTRSGLMQRWKRAEHIPFLNNEGRRLSLGDAVGNILLFVPFGFLLHGWRWSRRTEKAGSSHRQIGVSQSLLTALAFSGAIECGQLFLDGRVTSINDVINNFVGALIGIRLAVAHPGLVANTWETLKRMTRLRPFLVLGLATMAVQTFIALAPFDFTLKMENFQRQWLRWQYSWKELPSIWGVLAHERGFLYHFPHREHLQVILLSTFVCGTLLGAFLVGEVYRYGIRLPRLVWGSILATLGFYPVLAIAQFTVQSVRPFVFFPIAGAAGVTLGMLLMFTIFWLIALFPVWRES